MTTIRLAAPRRPRASVIIPAWRRAGLLRRCLASLAAHRGDVPFETVIMLNGATPDVTALVDREVEGARVVSSGVNLGFGGGCNRAARAATGEHLVLLNDDTEVDDGWLDSLVETADEHPDAGAVGSRIVSHDGLLLEAGGMVWREGIASHVGRGLPATTMRHRFLRPTDYCSGSSLLVRRTTWDAVGGFDARYFPGYYEDVDLCLSIAGLGQRILFQPRSSVRHHESGSLDWDSPFKHFVSARSQARFVAKWSSELDRFPSRPATDDLWERDFFDERALLASRRAHRRILIVDGESGAVSERLVAAAEDLARHGWSVTAFIGPEPRPDPLLSDLGVEILDGDRLFFHVTHPAILYDAVVFLGRSDYLTWSPLIRERQPQAALAYAPSDTATDVLALPQERSSPTGSPLIDVDRVVCATPFDAGLLAMVPGRAPVATVGETWAQAVDGARAGVLRRRSLDRLSGGPRR